MSLSPGDVGWASQKGWINRIIKWAQHRKYGSGPASHYNHVYLITGWNGELIQANGSGMGKGHVSDYAGQDVAYRRPPYKPLSNQYDASAAMQELLMSHSSYGFLTIVSVALSLLTGTKLRFGLSGQEICSGAVAYALTRANIDIGPDGFFDTPADLFDLSMVQGWAKVAS
jgi:hypothetical protein